MRNVVYTMFGKKDKNNVLHHSKLQPSKYVVAMLKGPSWSLGHLAHITNKNYKKFLEKHKIISHLFGFYIVFISSSSSWWGQLVMCSFYLGWLVKSIIFTENRLYMQYVGRSSAINSSSHWHILIIILIDLKFFTYAKPKWI